MAAERDAAGCAGRRGRACGERSGRPVGVRRAAGGWAAGGPANPAAWGPPLGVGADGAGFPGLPRSQDPAGAR